MTFLVQTTIYLTVTAAFLLLFKRIFKSKLSAKWQVYIWALLLIRFCIPSLPQSQLSVFNTVSIPSEYIYVQQTEADVEIPTVITTINTIIQDTTGATATQTSKFDWHAVIVSVWLCGAAVLFLYFFTIYCISLYKSKKQDIIRDTETLQLLEKCKRTVGIKRNVQLIAGENPMLIGWIRPKIVLPDGYSNEEKRNIFTHELCHLKSGDIPIIWCAVTVLCTSWFNPVLWYAFFTLRRDIEVYCDERVLAYCKDKKEYASLLLKSALAKNKFVLGTTSLQNGEKEVERRIKYMAYFKKPKVIWSIIIAVTAIAISALCLTNALTKEEPSDSNYIGNGFTFTPPTGRTVTIDALPREIADMHKFLDVNNAELGIIETASETDVQTIDALSVAVYGYNKGIYKKVTDLPSDSEESAAANTLTLYTIEHPVPDGTTGRKIYTVLFFETDTFTDAETDGMLASFTLQTSDLFSKTQAYLLSEFKRVVTQYYEFLDLQISRWKENGNEATFVCTSVYKNYDKDPDTVGYIQAAKENGSPHYESLKEEYLAPQIMNVHFKVIRNGNTPELYMDVGPNATWWKPIQVENLFGQSISTSEQKTKITLTLSDTTVTLSEEDAETIFEIINNGDWVNSATACDSDYRLTVSGNTIDYHSDCGTFNNVENGSSLSADKAAHEQINSILRKYVLLIDSSGESEQTQYAMLTTPLSIYRCDDVYRTENTPTHGSGFISVPLDPEEYRIKDCKILLCDDGCNPVGVVLRASQGYAVAYGVAQSAEHAVSDGWNYHTRKFIMEVPKEMIEDLQRQGVLESIMSKIEREYYYLLTLDETHYAYIAIVPKDTNTEKPVNEDAIVDEFVKKAKVSFTTNETEQTPLLADEATELLRDALITAYENTYAKYEPLYEDPSVTDDATYLRYAIATLSVTKETDRYYKFPVIFEFWVDKYTGEIYKVYNGLTQMMYPFDPYSDTALAFAG